jgi:hypothetical protein
VNWFEAEKWAAKVMFIFAMLSLGTLGWAGTARQDATDRLDNATNVVREIMSAPDSGICLVTPLSSTVR